MYEGLKVDNTQTEHDLIPPPLAKKLELASYGLVAK